MNYNIYTLFVVFIYDFVRTSMFDSLLKINGESKSKKEITEIF